MYVFVLAQMEETQMDDAKQIQAEVEAVQLAMLEAQLEEKRLHNQLLAIQVERERAELMRSTRKNDRSSE